MKLPHFRYHPDPVGTGSIESSEAECDCCNKSRGFIYAGPAYGEFDDVPVICPWCIADGSAHEQLGVIFTDDAMIGGGGEWEDVDDEIIEEVATRTPGFISWQGEQWFTHCGDAAQFLGRVGSEDLNTFGPKAIEAIAESCAIEDEDEQQEFMESLDKNGSPTAYLFKCAKCGAFGGYTDSD